MEPSLKDAAREQAVGRAARIGQTEEVSVFTVCAEDTNDQMILESHIKLPDDAYHYGTSFNVLLNRQEREILINGFKRFI